MSEEYNEIKEKLMNFFNKKQLSNETVYFILKDLQEDIWQEIKEEDEEGDMDDEELDEFEDFEPEEPEDINEEEEDEDLKVPELKSFNKNEAVRTFIKKPKIKIKESGKKKKEKDPDGLD